MASNKPGEFLGEHLKLLQRGFSFSGYEHNRLYRNDGKGFADISGLSGADHIGDGRGTVFWDYDDDGDTDIFVRAMHGPAHLLFRNEVGQRKNFVRVLLEGRTRGRDAFGAVVRVKTSAGIQTQLKSGGTGFVSSNDPRLLFGLGDDEQAEWLEVTWPNGRKRRIEGPKAGATVVLRESTN